jgi:signal peptidase II
MRASAACGRRRVAFFSIAASVLVVDQLSKLAALSGLDQSAPAPVVGDWVRLTLTHNVGSAFGLVSSGGILIAVGALVCLGIVGYAVLGGLEASGRDTSLGLILGGSLGNLLDRVRTGAVVDFVDLRVWPVFNIADVAITVGVGLLAFGIIRRH